MNAIKGDNMVNPNCSARAGENPDPEKSIMVLHEDEASRVILKDILDESRSSLYSNLNLESSK